MSTLSDVATKRKEGKKVGLYDRKCSKGHVLKDQIEKPDAVEPIKCPQCGKNMFRCLPEGTNFKLKGNGWTDQGSIGK